eukprot:358607-Chlamydomonas_euryale.AAC.1
MSGSDKRSCSTKLSPKIVDSVDGAIADDATGSAVEMEGVGSCDGAKWQHFSAVHDSSRSMHASAAQNGRQAWPCTGLTEVPSLGDAPTLCRAAFQIGSEWILVGQPAEGHDAAALPQQEHCELRDQRP